MIYIMSMSVQTKCPYCGHGNKLAVNVAIVAGREITLCDSDSGGCDRYYVASWRMNLSAEAKKIEGEEERHTG